MFCAPHAQGAPFSMSHNPVLEAALPPSFVLLMANASGARAGVRDDGCRRRGNAFARLAGTLYMETFSNTKQLPARAALFPEVSAGDSAARISICLPGMRERASQLGGTLVLLSAEGDGAGSAIWTSSSPSGRMRRPAKAGRLIQWSRS